jgi:hypothetical protein
MQINQLREGWTPHLLYDPDFMLKRFFYNNLYLRLVIDISNLADLLSGIWFFSVTIRLNVRWNESA